MKSFLSRLLTTAITCIALPIVASAQAPVVLAASRDSIEAVVMRAVLLVHAADSTLVLSRTTAPGMDSCDRGVRPPYCAPLGTAPFREAYLAYAAANEKRDSLPPAILRQLGPRWTAPDNTNIPPDCAHPRHFTLSRAGFDSTMTHAVVGFTTAIGKGRYPGCGYGNGSTALLTRQADGSWRITGTLGFWET